MTHGYYKAVERSGTPARALYPGDWRGYPDSVDAIESFARIASVWGAWLRNPMNPSTLTHQGEEIDIESILRQAMLEGTDSSNPRTYWGDIGHMDQRIVESADIAVAIWMSRERVFNKMTPAEQAQVIAWLAQVDGKGTYTDNWILFTAMTQVVRLHLGFPSPEDELDNRLMQLAEFYRGDGWYVDGPTDEFELYNAWMFGWHYLLWAWIDGDRRPDHREQVFERARSFISGFLHFFGANGSYPAWGRSIVYRFAALAPFAVGHFLQILPHDPGQLRRVSSGCLSYYYEHGLFDPYTNYIRQGYHGDFPAAGEGYISPGSPYWCSHGLFALTLDEDDPFWKNIESPLPVEQEDFELVLPAPGLLVSGQKSTGQVLLLNSRSGQEYDSPRHNYTAKYGKLAYSTHFPFNVMPVQGSYAPDGMVCLTRDEKKFGHRLHSRAGQVAPGFMWSHFDEILDGEPQPLWVTVLLWRDIQVRLSVLRPTFPVMAFEAPGALGCDHPSGIVRRSDPVTGWEYAEEPGGRAVSIQRLSGYDCQMASAPFMDQSNINLAYSYSEHPVVYESGQSVAPRCLAAASLIRPGPFKPENEFAGIKVEIHSSEIFHVTLPDDRYAFVAPGRTLPRSASFHGVDFAGSGIRFLQMTGDRNELSGLGLTQVSEVATFPEPASFRLKRTADGMIHLTTDMAVSLKEEWTGGAARCIEVQTLDGRWLDITPDCPGGSVSSSAVQAWQEKNQRTLVDFRIST
jgi:hypothetical protein